MVKFRNIFKKQENPTFKLDFGDGEGTKEFSKEDLQNRIQDLISGFEYFGLGNKMADDILSEKDLTIHQEKRKCKKAFSENSFIQAGVNNLLNVILGDDPGIKSEHEIFKRFSNKWLKISNYKSAMKKGLKQAIISGDGYVRKIKGEKSIKYSHIENAEDIYIEWDYKTGKPLRFIERLYYSQGKAKELGIKEYTLMMPWGRETITGIEYKPDEIIHFQFMEGRFGIYGRSPIASVLNDITIINKMERSIAIISVFKAIPRKLIMPDSTKEDEIMGEADIQNVINTLKQAKDFESPVVGKKMSSLNLTESEAIDLTGYLDYFKRKVSIVLNPEFIIHGELVNRNTGSEQKQIFYLSVLSLRGEFQEEIEQSIDEGLAKTLANMEDQNIQIPRYSYEFCFGEYDVELREEKNARLMNEWNAGTIKLNEYREEIGHEQDEEMGEFYKWELTGSPEQAVGESIKKLSNNEKLSKGNTSK